MTFIATKHKVSDQGVPPDRFLTDIITWAKEAPLEVYAPRKDDLGEEDIFTAVHPYLGPWTSLQHRLAVLLEIFRVLAAFESSWNYLEGRDISNDEEVDAETISAGIFQVSYNSRSYGADLRKMLVAAGIHDGDTFQKVMKHDHNFAFEYTARLLRHTIRHHGPCKRKRDTEKHHDSIYSRLRRDAVEEFQQLIATA